MTFDQWVQTAPSGGAAEYYRGYLYLDRIGNSPLEAVANTAMALAKSGTVTL